MKPARSLSFRSLDEVRAFVGRFEDGTLPKVQWVHAAHLAVAFWYLSHCPEDEATDRIRLGIRHYNACVGTLNTRQSGYHETLTRFWVAAVAAFMRSAGPGPHDVTVLNSLLHRVGGRKDLWRDFYSIDLVASVEARLGWIEPDRRPLTDDSFGWGAGQS